MFFKLLFVTLLTISNTISQTTPKPLTWLLGNTALSGQLEAAGEESSPIGNSRVVYVARIRIEGEWVPGKGFYRNGAFFAAVVFMGEVIESVDCQTPLRGSTKWVSQQKNRQIPADAVLGGYDPRTLEKTYICRGYAIEDGKPWLIVGKVFENFEVCRLPFNGETIASSFEVLAHL